MQVYDSAIAQTPVISALKGVWEKRSLLRLLVARDLTVRYKRSVIGIWWSLLNPLFTTAVMYYVFNTVFKSKLPDGQAFMPYLLSGVLTVTLFNQGMTMADQRSLPSLQPSHLLLISYLDLSRSLLSC